MGKLWAEAACAGHSDVTADGTVACHCAYDQIFTSAGDYIHHSEDIDVFKQLH
jgi:hypothetical protein